MMDPHYFGVSKEVKKWARNAVDSIDYAKLAPRVAKLQGAESDPELADRQTDEALIADARFLGEMQESTCEYCQAHSQVVEAQERALEWHRMDRDTLMRRYRSLRIATFAAGLLIVLLLCALAGSLGRAW